MKTGIYETLERSAATINERKGGDPEKSYVAKLFANLTVASDYAFTLG